MYEVRSNIRSIGKNLILKYKLNKSSFFSAEIETDEFRTDLTFKKDDLAFGDLVKGNGKYSRYLLKGTSEESGFPLCLTYSYDQLSLSGIGHFESWPFTTLAASIITNRLNYQLSGFIKHHSFESAADVQFGSNLLTAVISYHRILPDAVLEHWEPEFLVFGMKNFTRNPFSIRDIHLLGIKLHYAYPFNDFTLSAFVEQYIPLSIKYNQHSSTSTPSPSGPATPASPPTTDGGRRGGFFFTFRL